MFSIPSKAQSAIARFIPAHDMGQSVVYGYGYQQTIRVRECFIRAFGDIHSAVMNGFFIFQDADGKVKKARA